MPHRANSLLNCLSADMLDQIEPFLTTIEVPQGKVLAEAFERIETVYFPHSGIISCVVELAGGGAIETGMIGRDGVFGASQALNDGVSLNHVVVQVPGRMSVLRSLHLRHCAEQLPVLKKLIADFEQFLFAQVQQTAACNAVHDIQARACKWLLRMHDLIGTDLPLTQEFLAQMMGVRRTSVTAVASALQDAGMINYRRGTIRIVNLDRLKQAACECHADISSHYRRLFAPTAELAKPLRNRPDFAGSQAGGIYDGHR
jgi:CRP-like cAMP-binding protein